MKVLINYFTGTGNSLLVARKIAQRLDGAVLRPILKLKGTEGNKLFGDNIIGDANVVGFVFPVYFDRIPEIMYKVLEEIEYRKTNYIFAITTSGEATGNALYELDSLLRSNGSRLNYGKNVVLGDNSIILKTSQNKLEKRFLKLDETCDEIALTVNKRIQNEMELQRSMFLSILGRINRFAFLYYYKAEKRLVDSLKCNQCRQCVKLCPVENISMTNGYVKIGDHCQWCFACLNWCPQKAIRFGRIDPSQKHQYRSPGINVSDILRIKG